MSEEYVKSPRPDTSKLKVVNQPHMKKDAMSLVTGQPVYTDDLISGECLIVKVLRSPHAHAIIESINTKTALKVPGIEGVWTWEDVPQRRFTLAGQTHPETSCHDRLILDRRVRFVGDAVAIVAGDTEAAVDRALRMIKVKYQVLEPVLDFRKAKDNPILVHPEEDWKTNFDFVGAYQERNLCGSGVDQEGDTDAVMKECEVVLEDTFHITSVQQSMMETFRTYVSKDTYGRMLVISSTQIPFHVRRILSNALGIPKSKIRVVKPRIGGGFGAKQTAVCEIYPAFVTWKTGKPSKIVYSRYESMTCSSPRHEMEVTLKIGAMKDGHIRAMDMYALSNGGAYNEHGWATVGLVGHKPISTYGKLDAYRFSYDVVYTNTQAGGAYRGFGATQGTFAVECMVNKLADLLKIDPAELRLMNMTREGMTMLSYDGMVNNSCALDECMIRVKEMIGWDEKPEVEDLGDGRVRAMGIAQCMQGSGIAGIDIGTITMKMNDDGFYNLDLGCSDMGTGCDTILCQIAAEVLECELDEIVPHGVDTDVSPYDCGSYASSTTYITGKAAEKASLKLREKIKAVGARALGVRVEEVDFDGKRVYTLDGSKEISRADIATRSMDGCDIELVATAANTQPTSPPPFMVGAVDLIIDKATGAVEIQDYCAVVDCGTVINPALARVQTEGGLVQGIGMTLTEDVQTDAKGRILNNSFMQYKIPTRLDNGKRMHVEFQPSYEPTGPFGAKSIGEVVINTPAPAIASAIYKATGHWFTELPITPEKIAMLYAEDEE